MGYFDALTNSWFKKMEDGRSVFYPYGKFGTGYIICNNDEVKIKRFLKRCHMISLPVATVTVILFGLYAFVLLFFLIPFCLIKIKRMLSHSEKTQEKMTLKEVTKNMAISMGVPTSVLMLILGLLMTSASVFCIYLPNAKLVGILGTLFFGLCLLQSIILVRYSIRFKREKKQ